MFSKQNQFNSRDYFELANNTYAAKCQNLPSNTASYLIGYSEYLTHLLHGINCTSNLENFPEDKRYKELCTISYYDGLISLAQRLNLSELPDAFKLHLRGKEEILTSLHNVANKTKYNSFKEKCQALIQSFNKLSYLDHQKSTKATLTGLDAVCQTTAADAKSTSSSPSQRNKF